MLKNAQHLRVKIVLIKNQFLSFIELKNFKGYIASCRTGWCELIHL